MDFTKMDAALRNHLYSHGESGGEVGVSIRMTSPLTPEEVSAMEALGLRDGDTRRRVFFSRLPAAALPAFAKFEKVSQISLCQPMEPKADQPGE